METINLEPNWTNVYKYVMALDKVARRKFIKGIGQEEWEKLESLGKEEKYDPPMEKEFSAMQNGREEG